jgi:hypothetical protein
MEVWREIARKSMVQTPLLILYFRSVLVVGRGSIQKTIGWLFIEKYGLGS